MLDIDWKNPRKLESPKRKAALRQRFDRERLLRQKPSKGPKNHSVNRERSREEQEKAAAHKKMITNRKAAATAYTQAVREYWAGLRDEHPISPFKKD